MDRQGFERWLDDYTAAWMSNDLDDVGALFTDDARYYTTPFLEPWQGRDEIVRRWVAMSTEDLGLRGEVIAVDGDTGVARIWVTTQLRGDAVRVDHAGVIVCRFTPDARCFEHHEWYARREIE